MNSLPAVITSYSIHYTKLYEETVMAKGVLMDRGSRLSRMLWLSPSSLASPQEETIAVPLPTVTPTTRSAQFCRISVRFS